CSDHRPPQEVDVTEQTRAPVLGDHLAKDVAEHADVAPELGRYLLPGDIAPRGAQLFRAGFVSCAYSTESTSAARDASMMLLEQPTVVQRRSPRPDSMSTL